ncbi:MAG: SWIM zinc finger family protein [Candidatus Bathyarchaeota archaeon]|nr:SWIM zinc finger family protein [Candidatus Bathyarchaeota archaeon]
MKRAYLTKTARENNNGECIDADIIKHNFLTYFQHPPFHQHFPFNIKLPKRYCLEKGCIIDLETTSFSSWSGYIITMGILEKDRAIVHQLTVPKYKDFQVYCFQKARETQEPRYAYNARFESEFLQMEHGWIDLMQYKRVDRFPVCARGLEIAKAKESHIIEIDNFNYKVRSESSDRWYAVSFSDGFWTCGCPFWETYFEKCKHIWAVEFGFKGLDMEHVERDDLFTEI